ncbi:hypothetical protein SAMN05216251_102492 [Actinacidiphila alni]|uniref:VOC domain-containing protein n=1 Tax=Actinacidiphila alni TaxID=380248 RepID=A0A1I1ZKJ2_9ACTN|nr:VOC family protein [Actinacidiphila alni]SFE32354.1 hypothetical protein SAMN05216251_102492 [Actinacidiphila alni]
MTEFPEGAPCWADAMFADLDGAKRFYGDVLGWTFGESASEYGNYTQAYADGKAVAAVVPPMPGSEGQSAWCVYLAAADAAAAAEKVKAAGGGLLMEPMRVGDFGTMALATEPTGAVFGIWQPGQHKGFEKVAEPGAYAWAEIFTRDPAATDAFLPRVFPYTARQMVDEQIDFKIFTVEGSEDAVLGRMRMGDEFPPQVPSYVNVYFTVADCDATVEKARAGGATVRFGPMDSPFGRFAALTDPQGANFSVIDVTRTAGEQPKTTDA